MPGRGERSKRSPGRRCAPAASPPASPRVMHALPKQLNKAWSFKVPALPLHCRRADMSGCPSCPPRFWVGRGSHRRTPDALSATHRRCHRCCQVTEVSGVREVTWGSAGGSGTAHPMRTCGVQPRRGGSGAQPCPGVTSCCGRQRCPRSTGCPGGCHKCWGRGREDCPLGRGTSNPNNGISYWALEALISNNALIQQSRC